MRFQHGCFPPQVTRWHSERLTRGSYSYVSLAGDRLGISPGDLSKADGESSGRLRFAGEHTHRRHYSTVHGAMESGWREAERILREEGMLATDRKK